MDAPRIFISMGTPYTDDYSAFRIELREHLRRCGTDPRIIGENEYPDGNPLAKIREVMRSCQGVIIVAYERKYLERGAEKRGGTNELPLESRAYTTPWNHIESAMAYTLGLPLYIICQRGLAEEGLIETKLDWYVQHLDIKAGALAAPAVAESLRGWINRRVMVQPRRPRLFRALEGGLPFGEMTPREIWGVGAILSAVFLTGAFAARLLPQLIG